MRKSILLIGLFSTMLLMTNPIQANFVQCQFGVMCDMAAGTTDDGDVINGSVGLDWIEAEGGDDLVFGGPGTEFIDGGSGNDLLIGGPDSDLLFGSPGNDILLPGSDTMEFHQNVDGGEGNDSVNVLVSEVSSCLFIQDGLGIDTVNLIGFGPYSAVEPFGVPGFVNGWIRVVDPVTGGRIFIRIFENNDLGTEVVNGLLSPNITFLTDPQWADEVNIATGTDPCPDQPPVGP